MIDDDDGGSFVGWSDVFRPAGLKVWDVVENREGAGR